MRPVADALYQKLIPGLSDIERFKKGTERHLLDTEFAIDVKLALDNGMVMTMQEKFREWSEYSERQGRPQFRDVTVEYYNDPIIQSPGDWFNLSAQLYFEGYASKDESCFTSYILLDWLRVVIETVKGNVKWGRQRNTNGRAKADFRYTPLAQEWPLGCIVSREIDSFCLGHWRG
jgi:hypothetical protein